MVMLYVSHNSFVYMEKKSFCWFKCSNDIQNLRYWALCITCSALSALETLHFNTQNITRQSQSLQTFYVNIFKNGKLLPVTKVTVMWQQKERAMLPMTQHCGFIMLHICLAELFIWVHMSRLNWNTPIFIIAYEPSSSLRASHSAVCCVLYSSWL